MVRAGACAGALPLRPGQGAALTPRERGATPLHTPRRDFVPFETHLFSVVMRAFGRYTTQARQV